MECTGKTKNYN